jgi:hypothetical protein
VIAIASGYLPTWIGALAVFVTVDIGVTSPPPA